MPELAVLHNDQPMTTSLTIAEGVELQHKNVLELIRKHLDSLTEFGGVAFETRPFDTPGGVQQREIAWLNEPQATLLITFMRNSETVVRFKVALVKAFYELREQLARKPSPPPMPRSATHAADQVVAATRTFNGLLRAAKGMGLGRMKAVRQANLATYRHTGVDVLGELDVEQDFQEQPTVDEPDPWEEPIREWLDAQNREFVTYADVLTGAIGLELARVTRAHQNRLAPIMRRLGWRKTRRPVRDPRGSGRITKSHVYVRPEPYSGVVNGDQEAG